jgi:hypothetical protein
MGVKHSPPARLVGGAMVVPAIQTFQPFPVMEIPSLAATVV